MNNDELFDFGNFFEVNLPYGNYEEHNIWNVLKNNPSVKSTYGFEELNRLCRNNLDSQISEDLPFIVQAITTLSAIDTAKFLYKIIGKDITEQRVYQINSLIDSIKTSFNLHSCMYFYVNRDNQNISVATTFEVMECSIIFDRVDDLKKLCKFFPKDEVLLENSGVTGIVSRVIFSKKENKFYYNLEGDDTLFWEETSLCLK